MGAASVILHPWHFYGIADIRTNAPSPAAPWLKLGPFLFPHCMSAGVFFPSPRREGDILSGQRRFILELLVRGGKPALRPEMEALNEDGLGAGVFKV